MSWQNLQEGDKLYYGTYIIICASNLFWNAAKKLDTCSLLIQSKETRYQDDVSSWNEIKCEGSDSFAN
jgi:hypothetical protein